MSYKLLPVWESIKYYLNNGISVIPVRDQNDSLGIAKSPIQKSWKFYQETIIEETELFELMDGYNKGVGTTGAAIIGGKVSGNLEIIDVDTKNNYDGFGESLLRDLQNFLPDIFPLFRIHKTPSGGFHIPYRCSEPVPGNQKLAGRPATDHELSVKPKTKTYNFIETRGEGGYVLIPPSMGYSVIFDNPIPLLTEQQRTALISLCKSYSTIKAPSNEPYKPKREEETIYDENPFEDYNKRCDPKQLMQQLGWRFLSENNKFIWFERPDPREVGRKSCSFNKQTNFFYIFTSSTTLEESHGYSPSNLRAVLEYSGDKTKMFLDLRKEGYGKYKKSYERRLVSKAKALKTIEIPANVSEETKKEIQTAAAEANEAHPHGIFWAFNEKGYYIDGEHFLNVCNSLGFRLYNNETVQIRGKIIYNVTEREFQDILKQYIKIPDNTELHQVLNAYESFIEQHCKFRISRLAILQTDQILHDDKTTCYKFYNNGIIKITASSIEFIESNLLILDSKILRRDFEPIKDAEKTNHLYPDFLRLSIGMIDQYLFSVIGYLSHEYKDETMGYIIVLSEQCENPKDGGGSGKNVFAELFGSTTSICKKSGSQINYDERFLQTWDGQRLFLVSDVPKDFDFGFMKELSTGSGTLKKLFKDQRSVSSKEMPKFIITTNFSFSIEDGGVKRRVRTAEFTNFFTKAGGVDKHFKGVHFPDDWQNTDWNAFDSIIAKGIQIWLKNGCKLAEPVLSEGGWKKQFEQTFGVVITGFIRENISEWVKAGFMPNDVFKTQLTGYCNENGYKFPPMGKKINEALKEYSRNTGIIINVDAIKYVNGITHRGRVFTAPEVPF